MLTPRKILARILFERNFPKRKIMIDGKPFYIRVQRIK